MYCALDVSPPVRCSCCRFLTLILQTLTHYFEMARIRILAFIATLSVSASGAVKRSAAQLLSCTLDPGFDYFHGDLEPRMYLNTSNAAECCQACQENTKCNFFTFMPKIEASPDGDVQYVLESACFLQNTSILTQKTRCMNEFVYIGYIAWLLSSIFVDAVIRFPIGGLNSKSSLRNFLGKMDRNRYRQ